MVDSTERGVVDSGRETLVSIADVGCWIGSLCVVLINVVAVVVSERVHNSCVWRRSLSLHDARKLEDERRGGMRLEEGVCGEVCRSQYTEGEHGRLCCHGVACCVGGSKCVHSSGREEAEEEQMACPRKGSWL